MKHPLSLQEKKKHGEIRFPFNIYPCTIPGDFPQVALHWHDSMELVFVKKGHGFIQLGVTICRAQEGDIFIFSPVPAISYLSLLLPQSCRHSGKPVREDNPLLRPESS